MFEKKKKKRQEDTKQSGREAAENGRRKGIREIAPKKTPRYFQNDYHQTYPPHTESMTCWQLNYYMTLNNYLHNYYSKCNRPILKNIMETREIERDAVLEACIQLSQSRTYRMIKCNNNFTVTLPSTSRTIYRTLINPISCFENHNRYSTRTSKQAIVIKQMRETKKLYS